MSQTVVFPLQGRPCEDHDVHQHLPVRVRRFCGILWKLLRVYGDPLPPRHGEPHVHFIYESEAVCALARHGVVPLEKREAEQVWAVRRGDTEGNLVVLCRSVKCCAVKFHRFIIQVIKVIPLQFSCRNVSM